MRRWWRELDWFDQFGAVVISCFVVLIVGLFTTSLFVIDEPSVPPSTTTMLTAPSDTSRTPLALDTADDISCASTATTAASPAIMRP